MLTEEQAAERRAESLGTEPSAPAKATRASTTEFWFEWGKEDNRTAMIDDPADGRIPMKPGVREQELGLRTARRAQAEEPRTWLDMSIYDRCITRWGLPSLPTN